MAGVPGNEHHHKYWDLVRGESSPECRITTHERSCGQLADADSDSWWQIKGRPKTESKEQGENAEIMLAERNGSAARALLLQAGEEEDTDHRDG